uniref:M20/M25/M40 family metallo-hydrolase n=1 Tax=Acidobacterium capsulatum TaxID=33075 RepID=A0A7V4XRH5_9BACT
MILALYRPHFRHFCPGFGFLLALLLCAGTLPAHAQHRDLNQVGQPIPAMQPDAAIVDALQHVSVAKIRHTIHKLVSFHTRSTLSMMDADLPKGQGIKPAIDWVTAQFDAYSKACGGCLVVKHTSYTQMPGKTGYLKRIPGPTTITDTYAVLKGTDPAQANRVILVSGHLDSRDSNNFDSHGAAPGANDDGSGTAVTLECARVLSKMHFPATLVFVVEDGEEQGLFGSKHMAEQAKKWGWQIEGVLNNDIVGGDTTPGHTALQDHRVVRLFSEPVPANATPQQIRELLMLGYDSDSPSRELARAVVNVARSYTEADGLRNDETQTAALRPVMEFRLDRFLRGGDHYSFNQEGFAAVRFTEWRENFHHQHQNVRVENGIQYGDLPQFVDYPYVAHVARLNAASMASLATAPPPPADVRIVVSELDNNSTLKWKAGAGAPSSTHYWIVWRPTASPNWTREIPATKLAGVKNGAYQASPDGSYTATLPISKDNVIFGVESVGPHGQRSLAVVPMPTR